MFVVLPGERSIGCLKAFLVRGRESERIGGLDEMVRDILMVASVLAGIREFYWMWRLYGSGFMYDGFILLTKYQNV